MLLLMISALAASPVSSPPVKARDLLQESHRIPKDLFYLAQKPSGVMACDNTLRRQQNREFDRRYGRRFNRLVEVISAREGLGWQPDDIILVPCFSLSQEKAGPLLDQFGRDLRAYQDRYGLRPDPR